jgi:hypothetical protein
MATFTVHVVAGALSALLAAGDAFSFLAPQVVLTAVDRRQLAEGKIVARTLEARDGQVASFAISRVEVPPDALLTAARSIEDLSRSPFVTGIQRFSNPPQLSDLDALRLAPRDVAAAASCQPGNCSFKLTAGEIALLRNGIGGNGSDEAVQQAFRQVVLARVNAYLATGLPGLGPPANRSAVACFDEVFNRLAAASPALPHAPWASRWLRDFPCTAVPMESFLYWSYETYGAGKPVVVVTHIGIIPPAAPGEPAIVVGKQVMATRYMTGGLSLMAITTDEASGAHYLVYINRIGVDLLGGLFGSIKRAALESRLRRELPDMLLKLRTRLERTAGSPTR